MVLHRPNAFGAGTGAAAAASGHTLLLHRVLVLMLLAVSAVVLPVAADVSTPCSMLLKTNSYRAAFGLRPLILDQRLNQAAQYHTNEMEFNCGLQHESCSDPKDWYLRVGNFYPDWIQLGENVAKNSWDENQVLGAYKRSPEHNANLLNGDFTSMGSYYDNGWWTQDFGVESPTHAENYVACSQDPSTPATWDGRLRKTTEEALCMDAGNGVKFSVRVMKCDGGLTDQLVTLRPNGDGSFSIYFAFRDACVDVFGGATGNGAQVGLWACTGKPNQQFFFNSDGSVSPAHARGQCLELAKSGVSHKPKTVVSTWSCSGKSNQKWTRSATV
ncbi:ricin B lectin domain-containing protein [Zopfochytrium polystomum]|nr:ricin B lectin domain-containing protein [Zopfochytrium polystomum]